MKETLAESAKRMEGAPNTAVNGQKCELRFTGTHICGGAVSRSWGDRFLCSVGWLMFSDHYHAETPRILEAWMRTKGWKP